MAKFTKLPVTIDAIQLTAENLSSGEIASFMGPDFSKTSGVTSPGPVVMFIETLEGTHRADEGDWIIKGIKGEFYPCKPDIFEATYRSAAALDMRPEFAGHRLTDAGVEAAKAISSIFNHCLASLEEHCPPGRHTAILRTKLEEACFFAKKAMAGVDGNSTSF